MRDQHLVNLGSLVSEAEHLRTRALAQMQAGPAVPVEEADRRIYAELLAAARAVGGIDGPAPAGVEEPADLVSVAGLHRSAGLIQHELLVRLAEARAARARREAEDRR